VSSKGLKILVTGGAGYIGSHTTHQLIAAGHQVTVVDNLYSGHHWAVSGEATFVEADAGDSKRMLSIMADEHFDAVIHFAGHIVVPESVSDPGKYYRNNVIASLNLIESAQASEIGMFIFSSSAAVYGNPKTIPVSETTAPNPINPYGRTKLITEWTLQDMAQRSGQANPLRYVALRYFNVAGAHRDGILGQATPEATHLIKVACETACGKRESMSIYGTDYDTPDGTCIRDYIHVEDLAAAHLSALNYLAGGGDSRILNCGYGHGYSVREVLDTVRRVNGADFAVAESNRRAGDPAQLVADNSAIREALGWAPKYDDLEIICETALRWEQNGNRPISKTG